MTITPYGDLLFSPLTLTVVNLSVEDDVIQFTADTGQQFTLQDPKSLGINVTDFVVGDIVYATIDQYSNIHRALRPGTPECRFDFIMQAMASRLPKEHNPSLSSNAEERYLAAIDNLLELTATSPRYTLVGEVLAKCYEADQYDGERTPYQVLSHATSELGETAEEVNIHMGNSYKTVGPDGVVGEAIDTIATLLDLIYLVRPDITEAELAEIARNKCQKWISNIKKSVER